MSQIVITELKKYYGKSRGIENVSFDVQKGEIVGFVGPNGAGKSTTIKILMGLASADEGSATIGGQTTFGNAELRKQIGYVSSDSIFYKNFTAREIFELTAKLYGRGSQNIKRLADMLDLDLHKKIGALSMGNRKKVGIINALLHEPSVLIFDEPTNGLDPLIQKQFFELVHEAKERGSTVLLSTHVLSDVQNHCDRAVIIREGRIASISTIEQLLGSSVKEVRIVFADSVPDLAALAGAEDLRLNGQTLVGDYFGDVSQLLQAVSSHKISDCTIQNGDLDKIILKFYEHAEVFSDEVL